MRCIRQFVAGLTLSGWVIGRSLLVVATAVLTVVPAARALGTATTTVLSVSPSSPAQTKSLISISASVTVAGGAHVSSGSVFFFDMTSAFVASPNAGVAPRAHLLGSAQIRSNGAALFQTILPSGTHSLTAVYMATPTYATSSSAASTFTVTGGGNEKLSLTGSLSGARGNYGFQAQLKYQGITPPTGTVQVVDTTASNQVIASTTHLADQGQNGFGFGQTTFPIISGGANNVALADLHQQGFPDLLVPHGTTLAVFQGNGDGTFGAETDYTTSGSGVFVATGDVNNDGYLDVVVADGSGTVSVFLNDTTGNLLAAATYTVSGAGRVLLGDLISGNLDIAVLTPAGIVILPNNGNGTFGTATTVAASSPTDMTLADLNGDGSLDIAITSFSNSNFTVFLNNGSGGFAAGASTYTYNPGDISAGDFDGDGLLDLAIVSRNGVFLFYTNNGSGTSFNQTATGNTAAANEYPFYNAVGDLDGDGWLDTVIGDSNASKFYALYNSSARTALGAPAMNQMGPFTSPTTTSLITMGDLDSDGLSDFALAGSTPSLWHSFRTINPVYPYASQTSFNVTSTTSLAAHTLELQFVPATNGSYQAATSNTFSAAVMGNSTPALSTSAASIAYHNNVTYTAVLSPISGVTPTGSVTFMDGANALSTITLSGGTASYTHTRPDGGTHIITAVYSGDSTFISTTSAPLNQVVVPEAPTVAISRSAATQIVAGSITLTGTVTSLYSSMAGLTLNFDIGGLNQGSCVTNSSGTCSAAVEVGNAGSLSATVVNVATTNMASGTAATTVTGYQYTAAPQLTVSPSASYYGQNVTMTISLPSIGGLYPTGLVNVNVNGSLFTAPISFVPGVNSFIAPSGVIVFPTTALPLGTDTIAVTYGGELSNSGATVPSYVGGATATVTHTVVTASIVNTVTLSPANTTQGTPQTITATVAASGNVPVANAIVQFFDTDATPSLIGTGQIASNGTASIERVLSPGQHSIYAVATLGGAGHTSTSSNPTTTTVTPSITYPLSMGLTLAGTPGSYTLTATATHASDYPLSAAAFLNHSNGNTTIATAPFGAPVNALSTTQTLLTAGIGGLSSAVGDVNNDGISDIVVSNYNDRTLSVFLGNGNGTFQTPVVVSTGVQYAKILLLDMNNDGNLDVVAYCDGCNAFYIQLGNGNGTFQASANSGYNAGGEGDQLVFGDFNKDGYFDILSSDGPYQGTLYVGQGDGTFNTSTVGQLNVGLITNYANGDQKLYGVAVGDFNGDGNQDVVYAAGRGGTNQTGSIKVLLGDGNAGNSGSDGFPSGYVEYNTLGTTPYGVAVGDFNEDGNLDIAAANEGTHTIDIFLGNGDGTFQAPVSFPAGTSGPGKLIAVDVDGDGSLDLLALDTNTTVQWGVNGNGSNIYTISSANAFLFLKGNGDGTFETAVSTPTGANTTPFDFQVGDFNGDGIMDLAVTYIYDFNNNQNNAPTTTATNIGIFLGKSQSTAVLTGSAALNSAGPVQVEAVHTAATPDAYATTTSNIVQLQSNTTVAVTSSGTPSPFGSSLTISATPATVGGITPTGTVQIYDGATLLTTATLASGVATYTTSALTRGTHDLQGIYNGDANYTSAVSPLYSQYVANPAITAVLASSLNPSTYNAAVTLTLTLGNSTATGTVRFYDGANLLGSATVASGVATLSTSTFAVGSHTLTANYLGDGNFSPATSAAVTQVVNLSVAATTALSVSPASIVYGNAATMTATLGTTAATGTVQFTNAGGTLLGTAPVVNGIATFTTSSLSVASYTITATYSGDTNYATSASATAALTVTQATPVFYAVTASPSPSVYGGSVTLTQAAPPGATGSISFTANGTALGSATIVNGVATFTTTALPTGSVALTTHYGGSANYAAANPPAGAVTVNQATPVLSALTASPTTASVGSTITLTQTVPSGATGSVTFSSGGVSLGSAAISGSTATLTTTALPVGANSVIGVYGGNTNYTSATSSAATVTITASPTTMALAASPTSGAFGTSVTFTATLTVSSGGPPSSGTVTFQLGGSTIGTGSIASGVATFTSTTLPGGSAAVTAIYAATTNYGTSTATATVTISQATPSLAAPVISPANGPYGTSLTLTQTFPAGATGTVSFYSGATLLGTATISGGVATLTTTTLPVGTNSITTSWPGNTNYTAATSPAATATITQATPVLAAPTLSPASSTYGGSVTITQTVPAGATGTVSFYAGAALLGTGTVSGGVATLTTTAISGGTQSITGHYSGNTNYTAATSAAASIAVALAAPSLAAPTASPSASTYGTSVTLTQTVPVGATGTINFYAGATLIGSGTISGGVATLTTTALPVGTVALTTQYGGNGNFQAGTSAAGSIVVTAAATATTLSASPTSGTYGTSVTVTATVTTGGSPLPGGTVNFQLGGATIGTGATNGSGVATYTTTTLSAGANVITAVSAATTNYGASASSPATVTISQATPSLSVPTLSPTSSTYGNSVTITQTVPTGATGTVNFYAGATLLGTGTISGGVATLATTAIPAGIVSITGAYSGNTNFIAATSPAASIVVAQATPVLTAPTASPSSTTYGTSVTLTQPVPSGVTGTITFYANGISVGTGTISGGVATLSTTTLPVGTNALTTQYGGSANYTASTSLAGSIVVAVAPTVSALSALPTSATYGTSVALTATVTANGAAVTSGTVNFQIGGASIGTATLNGSGVATLTTTALNVASNTAIVIFGATGNYSGSASPAVTIAITQATPTLGAPSISPSSAPYGTGVTLTQTFPAGATGTASFYSGGVLLGTATISGGVATLTTTAIPVGGNTVTTQWPGGGNYTGATSAAATAVITQATPVLGAPSASPASPTFGSTVTITQTVPPGATGTVTFSSGGVTLGTGTIVNGVATITTTTLAAGANALLATYNGNGNYTTATATGSVTVSQATPILGALTASPTAGPYGTPVTLTQNVPPGATGVVTFMSGPVVLGTATIANGTAALVAPLLPAGSNNITGLYGGNANYGTAISSPATVTISQITPTLAAPAVSPASITYGGSVTLTQIVPAGATGTVIFASGATVLGTATIANGVATLTTTAIPGGSSPVTGFYGGNSNYTSAVSASTIVTVTPAPLTLAPPGASPTGGPYGTPITLTQTVPTGVTGTVTFSANGVTLGTGTIVNGVATLTTTTIPVGTNLTVGSVLGNTNYTGSTSGSTTVTVTQATPVLSATVISPANAPFGATVTLTQTVPPGATGTVTFSSGGVTLGTATIVNGVATYPISSLPVGSQAIAGAYNGNANYTAATAVAGSVTVTQATPTLAAPTSSPPNPAYGASVTLTQTVPSGVTGMVTFMSGSMVLGIGTIANGVATLTTTALATGPNAVTGIFGGNTNYTSATSPSASVTVTPATTTLPSPSASPTSITYGRSVTLTQTLPAGATGTVTFNSGSTVLGTVPIVNGTATLTTTALPGGSSPITGTFNGNLNYAPSTSAPTTVVVAPAIPVLGPATASPAGGPYGASITLTQVMRTGATGTVIFAANGVTLGTGAIVNGVATFTTTTLPVGANIVINTYPGNGNYTSGNSSPATVTVTQATPVLAAPVSSPANATVGASVTLTQTVPPGATGLVTFMSGTTVLGTATIVNGVATLTTTIPLGSNAVTGSYGGNGNYTSATSAPTTVTIVAAATTVVLMASPGTAPAGAPVTLTATVSSNGTPIGSTTAAVPVQFFDGTTSLGSSPLSSNGVATLYTASLAVGIHSLSAVFGGSGIYPAGTSAPVTVTVGQIAATLSAPVASPTSGVYGTSVTLTQTVPSGATGTVTFTANGVTLGVATIVNGVAALVTTVIPAGVDTITGVYIGNPTYAPTTSAAATVTIQQATPAVPTLTASPTAAVFSTPITLTAIFPGNLGGSASFAAGPTTIGSAVIVNGAATLTTTALPVGADAVTATFVGNNNYTSATSAPTTVTITPPTYTITADPPSLTIHAGQTGTTVLTFTPVGGYTGTFTIACNGLPANAACQFLQSGVSNAVVVMNGSNQPVRATLNLMTSVPTATALAARPPSSSLPGEPPVYAFLLPAGLLALAGSIRHRKRLGRFGSLLALTLAAGATLTGLSGCGGGGFGVTATPAGQAVVQVTASASAVSTPGTGNGGSTAPALNLSITIIQ